MRVIREKMVIWMDQMVQWIGWLDFRATTLSIPKLAHYKMFVRLAYQVRPDLGVDSQH